MRSYFLKLYWLLALPLLLCVSMQTLAHGSVTAEDDLCVIRIGFYTAHFKIFQPRTSASREFCEDLPAAGETIFVMEYLHQALGTVPLDFRIVRNETGLGSFTRLDDLLALGDLEEITEFHATARVEEDVYTERFEFTREGAYLGVVTARHPQTEELFMAVFPFQVGKVDWGFLPLLLGLAVLAQLLFWHSNGSLKRWYQRTFLCLPVLLLCGLVAEDARAQEIITSESGHYLLSYRSETQPVPLNTMHQWLLTLTTSDQVPVSDAVLTLVGGMPAHNHGLPTAPVVSAHLGHGEYRVEGLRFHMPGEWKLTLDIKQQGRSDRINIALKL